MGRAGFVPDQDVANAGIGEQRIVNRQHRAPGITEDEFDPLADQAFDQDACAAALFTHRNSPSSFSPPS